MSPCIKHGNIGTDISAKDFHNASGKKQHSWLSYIFGSCGGLGLLIVFRVMHDAPNSK
jgi:hypothetical protein